jgi:two-component system response regulator AtoC
MARSAAGDEPVLGLQLFVMGNEGFVVHGLPASGVVVLGRGDDADLLVNDPHVSRRHARLYLGGDAIQVEDLAGVNGTFVRGQRVPAGVRVAIAPGETLGLGETVCVLQARHELPGQVGLPQAAAETEALLRRVPAHIIFADERMRRLYALAVMAAQSPINVLILGETGVGKELLAQAIHSCSARSGGPLVSLNCATFAENLLESELFGHEKGAFTGAVHAKEGLLESAAGGTVFLDEIGEMSPGLQARLLRVLEEREVRRVGALRPRAVDIRLVAATNRDLAADVHRGTFRKDLFFRLTGFTLHVPPLRGRPADIAPLAARFLKVSAGMLGAGRVLQLTAPALARLEQHPWPGNVRELRNVIDRAVLLCRDGKIGSEHLIFDEIEGHNEIEARANGALASPPAPPASAPPATTSAARSAPTPPNGAGGGAGTNPGMRAEMAAIEQQRITEALERFGGNQTRAAAYLKISRRTLLKRLDAYGANRPRKPRPEA